MKKITYIIAAFIIFSLVSCEGLFTTVREIDIPQHEQKISINSILRGDSIGIFISHSKTIDDDTDYNPISAKVTVMENGKELINFDYKNINNYDLISMNKLPENIKEGAEYSLVVDSENFGIAKASDIAPNKANIGNLKFNKELVQGEYEEYNRFEFVIDDDKSENNFYIFKFRVVYEDPEKNRYSSIYATTDDPHITSVYDRSNILDKRQYGSSLDLLSDKSFNGTKRKVVFKVNRPSYDYGNGDLKYKIFLDVETVSKTYFNFLIAQSQAQDVGDNPFAEPVVVSGNIDNGYGVFAAIFKSEFLIFEK